MGKTDEDVLIDKWGAILKNMGFEKTDRNFEALCKYCEQHSLVESHEQSVLAYNAPDAESDSIHCVTTLPMSLAILNKLSRMGSFAIKVGVGAPNTRLDLPIRFNREEIIPLTKEAAEGLIHGRCVDEAVKQLSQLIELARETGEVQNQVTLELSRLIDKVTYITEGTEPPRAVLTGRFAVKNNDPNKPAKDIISKEHTCSCGVGPTGVSGYSGYKPDPVDLFFTRLRTSWGMKSVWDKAIKAGDQSRETCSYEAFEEAAKKMLRELMAETQAAPSRAEAEKLLDWHVALSRTREKIMETWGMLETDSQRIMAIGNGLAERIGEMSRLSMSNSDLKGLESDMKEYINKVNEALTKKTK
jgi:hypothetical protein